MTVPLTVGSFSSHSAMVVLNESSLLVRCRRAGRCAGAFRYLRMVCPPMRRCCAILRIGQCSDQYRRCRSLICSVESMSAILCYPAEAACAPGRCCLQDSETEVCAAEVFPEPRLALELSCCWQDAQGPIRAAKPLPQNVLDQK